MVLTWQDVERAITGGEGERTEFKETFEKSEARKAICAFANTFGGLLIVGVRDDGTIGGTRGDPDAIQEKLTQLLQNGLSVPIGAVLGREATSKGWVHWASVPRLRGSGPVKVEGRVWLRRGRSSVEPSESELLDLYNTYGTVLTEERTVVGSSLSDVDVARFREHLRLLSIDMDDEPKLELADDLRNRAVLDLSGGAALTLYGVLAFAYEPQRFRHTASHWIECVAYAGNDRSDDVILVSEAKGRLDDQVEQALGWMRVFGRTERYTGAQRTDTPRIPERSMREILVNAVAHRDYAITGSKILLEAFDDRVVVTSPGVLPNHMTPASVRAGGHPRSRNELMTNFMLSRRKMEGRGRGFPIVRREMREFNGSEPELIEDRDGGFVRVILRTTV